MNGSFGSLGVAILIFWPLACPFLGCLPCFRVWVTSLLLFTYMPPTSPKCVFCSLLFQSSSIDFLASQGFDFNKVFRNGKIIYGLSLELVIWVWMRMIFLGLPSETESQSPGIPCAALEFKKKTLLLCLLKCVALSTVNWTRRVEATPFRSNEASRTPDLTEWTLFSHWCDFVALTGHLWGALLCFLQWDRRQSTLKRSCMLVVLSWKAPFLRWRLLHNWRWFLTGERKSA